MFKITIASLLISGLGSLMGTVSAQSFSVEDKLAIMDLVQRWNLTTDDGQTAEYLALYGGNNPVLVNPFGTFNGLEAIKGFQQDYTSKGAAVGKRHCATNLIVQGNGNRATATTDLLIVEVKEIPMIVATVRAEFEVMKTAQGWRITQVKHHLDEGFMKLQAKLKATN